jgi:hypothetical protein
VGGAGHRPRWRRAARVPPPVPSAPLPAVPAIRAPGASPHPALPRPGARPLTRPCPHPPAPRAPVRRAPRAVRSPAPARAPCARAPRPARRAQSRTRPRSAPPRGGRVTSTGFGKFRARIRPGLPATRFTKPGGSGEGRRSPGQLWWLGVSQGPSQRDGCQVRCCGCGWLLRVVACRAGGHGGLRMVVAGMVAGRLAWPCRLVAVCGCVLPGVRCSAVSCVSA